MKKPTIILLFTSLVALFGFNSISYQDEVRLEVNKNKTMWYLINPHDKAIDVTLQVTTTSCDADPKVWEAKRKFRPGKHPIFPGGRGVACGRTEEGLVKYVTHHYKLLSWKLQEPYRKQ